MINFLKKLFTKNKKTELSIENKQTVIEEIPEFIAERAEEIYLLNLGFKYSYGNLIKKKDGSTISYNLENKNMTISKDGGNIVLVTGGDKSKIKRFYDKYFI